VNRRVVTKMLERLGYVHESVEDGQEAFDAVEGDDRFDAILLDVQMPNMDGLEAARRIRASEPEGSRVPIIALTAHAMEGDRERCLNAGMDGYLTKPIRTDDLRATLKRLRRRPGEPQRPHSRPGLAL